MNIDKVEKIKRSYCFIEQSTADAVQDCLAWLDDTDGTIIVGNKCTLMNALREAFNITTDTQFKKFQNDLESENISIQVMQNSVVNLKYKKVLMLYLTEKDLESIEIAIRKIQNVKDVGEVRLLVWNFNDAKNWVRRYKPKLKGTAPKDWNEEVSNKSSNHKLPEDISKLLEHIALESNLYSDGMNYRERDALTEDLRKHKTLWSEVSGEDVRDKCNKLEMTLKDINEVVEIVKKNKN